MCLAPQIVAAQPLTGGQEIFNCYGELSNTELLLKYGFALSGNPFSAVELEKGGLLLAAQREHGAKAYAKRRRFLLNHRFAVGDSLAVTTAARAAQASWSRPCRFACW